MGSSGVQEVRIGPSQGLKGQRKSYNDYEEDDEEVEDWQVFAFRLVADFEGSSCTRGD